MSRLSIKSLLIASIIVGALLAIINNAWLYIYTGISGYSAPLLINPVSATMASLLPMIVASIFYIIAQRFDAKGQRAYVIGAWALGLLSTWSSFAAPMPDGGPTPLSFTILSLPMHITATLGALMIPRIGSRLGNAG